MFDSLPFINRIKRNPLPASIISLATVAIGGITLALIDQERDKDAIRDAMIAKGKDPKNKIAVAKGASIHVFSPKDFESKDPKVQIFQVGNKCSNLLWLDENRLVFSCEGPQGISATAVGASGKKEQLSIFPNQIKILDTSTQKLTTLIDPFAPTSSFTELFGDIKASDQIAVNAEADETTKFFQDEKSKIKIKVGGLPDSSFTVEDIASNSNSDVYFKRSNTWYYFNFKKNEISKPTEVPSDLISSQLKDGKLELVEPDNSFLSSLVNPTVKVRIPERSNNNVLSLEEGSTSAAWWSGLKSVPVEKIN